MKSQLNKCREKKPNDLELYQELDEFIIFLKDTNKQACRKIIRQPEILSFEAAALAKASRSKQKMGSNAIQLGHGSKFAL